MQFRYTYYCHFANKITLLLIDGVNVIRDYFCRKYGMIATHDPSNEYKLCILYTVYSA